MECLKCKIKLNESDLAVTCWDCRGVLHTTCTNLTIEEIRLHRERKAPWRCAGCTKKRGIGRIGVRRMGNRQDKYVSSNKILAAKKNPKNPIKRLSSVNRGISKVEVTGEIAEKLAARINALQSTNKRLTKQVDNLTSRLNLAEQITKSNTIEIMGIHEKKNENLISVVKKIANAVNFPFKDEMVDACYRINRQSRNGSHNIILTFVRRFDKEGFLKCYRRTENLSTMDLGRKDDYVIYIKESLSMNRELLLIEARRVAEELKFKGVGIVNGEIFMKESASTPAIVIRDIKDLHKLLIQNQHRNEKSD